MKYTAQQLLDSGEITMSQYLNIKRNELNISSSSNSSKIFLINKTDSCKSIYASFKAYLNEMDREEVINYITNNTHYNEGSAGIIYSYVKILLNENKVLKRTFKIEDTTYLLEYADEIGELDNMIDGIYKHLKYLKRFYTEGNLTHEIRKIVRDYIALGD